MISVFDYDHYQDYLLATLGKAGARTGRKMAASNALGVHPTMMSKVLQKSIHLSLEQAEALNDFLRHSLEEADYFMLLVLRDRAGSQKLKDRFQAQIQQIRDLRLNAKARAGVQQEVPTEIRQLFFSSPLYSQIHILITIPEFQLIPALAAKLKLSIEELERLLKPMLDGGMIEVTEDKVHPRNTSMFLDNDSPEIIIHHTNWRVNTVRHLPFRSKTDLHYSGIFSISAKDAQKIREDFLEQLKKHYQVMRDSKEEAAYVYCYDFYEI